MWENMREKWGNTLDLMLRTFATENNVERLVSSLETLASNWETPDCTLDLLASIVDL